MFISFEGIEGTGKSTQLSFMAEALKKKGVSVLITREPGGTEMGEEMRDILLKHRHEQVSSVAELLLMFAARVQHVETLIRPALADNKWVLCDRFTDASYAYQGGGRGVPLTRIATLEKLVLGNFRPDLTIVLDASAEVGLKRAHHRSHPDRFEKEQLTFFERVRAVYLQRAKQNPKQYKIIDATRSLHEVQAVLSEVIDGFFPKLYHEGV